MDPWNIFSGFTVCKLSNGKFDDIGAEGYFDQKVQGTVTQLVWFCFPMSSMGERGVSLQSRQWSCSELVRGAELCADLAGLSLTASPESLTRDQLMKAIQDFKCESKSISAIVLVVHHCSYEYPLPL